MSIMSRRLAHFQHILDIIQCKYLEECLKSDGNAAKKYKEYMPYVHDPINISPELEGRLIGMFTAFLAELQSSSMIASYVYILRQLLTLCGECDIAIRIPMISSKVKMDMYNTRWESMCKKLHWPYIAIEATGPM
jgi:hypothetical protein